MNLRRVLLAVLFTILCSRAFALEPDEFAVAVRVTTQTAPPAITLSWPEDNAARQYVIRKKNPSDTAWSAPLAVLPGSAKSFIDAGVSPGSAVEYEVRKEFHERTATGFFNAYTYIYAGIQAPLRDRKGKVIVLVDSTVAAAIAPELDVYLQDLVGAGWTPVRREVSRNAPVTQVKEIIRAEYNADPSNVRSLVLIGHVPVPYSGNIAPDLHETHQGAWPADLYYGDIDGIWTDRTVNVTSFDHEANDNYPGDGKFDQSEIPSPVELEVGRIDFWNLPAFAPNTETDLLRNYLRKNHQFRHRQFTAVRRGLIRDNFRDVDGDAPAVDAWRHYGVFFGSNSVREVGPDQFFPTLSNESFLWAYGAGGGSFTKADGVGTTWDFAAFDPQTVFLMLHGSYFGDWNHSDNFLRAAIATPNYTLASIWTGLPHWFMHHMALGETIGFSTRLTQNNRDTYKSNVNLSSGQVHIALIGDPTLEMFPVVPPADLSASAGPAVNLTWSPSTDTGIVGYHVYYSQAGGGRYQRLTASPQTITSFTHAIGAGTHHYMVRAVKLESTGSGSFHNASQGVFTAVSKTSDEGPPLPVVTVTVEDGDASELGQNSGSFRIHRSGTDGSAVRVEFIIGGLATLGVDYEPIPMEITIPAGSSSALVTITPKADAEAESDESVTLLLKPGVHYTVGMPLSAVLFIKNHSSSPPMIESLHIEAGGAVVLNVSGDSSRRFRVETTSDARSWGSLGEGSCDANGRGEYRDQTANGTRMRLYRLAWAE